jgi:hypothetical protein
VRKDDLSLVLATTVVRDAADEVMVYRRPGDPMRWRKAVKGGPRDRAVLEWREGWRKDAWHTFRVLVVKRPADDHTISMFWRDDRFEFWYVDLHSPLRRTATGFDFVENGLDIVVDPDLSGWRWKDEDELAWAVAAGRYSQEESDDLRREGQRAVARLLAERPRWEALREWTPDPSWPRPDLPNGWDAP